MSKSKKSNDTDTSGEIENTIKTVLDTFNSMDFNSSPTSSDFNINIADYTMDELFGLLSVNVTPTSNYDDIKTQIEKSTDNFIKQFQALRKPDIVEFFKQVKKSLIGTSDTLSTNEQNIITYDNVYNPTKVNVEKYGSNMFDQNNGAGNPIHRKTVTKLLNIDSRFRPNYLSSTTTDYLIDLPYPIHNVTEMTLCDLELPSTFYPISASYQNNYFWIKTTNFLNEEHFYYVVIPDGNYYFQTLITNINNIFTSLKIHLSMSFDLNYNNVGGVGEGTGLTKIGILNIKDLSGNNADDGLDGIKHFEINFNASIIPNQTTSIGPDTSFAPSKYSEYYYIPNPLDYKQLFGWILGFRKPFYTGVSRQIFDIGYVHYISESVLDLTGPKYLFLVIDDFNKSMNINFLSASVKGLLKDNIIARISQKGQLFSIQSQNDFSVYAEPRYYYGPVNISKIQVQLIDEYGRVVELNNKDFSFTLRLTTIYSVT